MLAHLLAIGLLAAPDSGGIGDVGVVIATVERTAVLKIVQATTLIASSAPLGATAFPQQYDPGDHAPYALDFAALLGDSEKIAAIEAIKMTSAAALLGIGVDQTSQYAPIIDLGGKKVQLWFVVDPLYWDVAGFVASGVQLPVTVRVLTDATPPKRYERTAILTVRQL